MRRVRLTSKASTNNATPVAKLPSQDVRIKRGIRASRIRTQIAIAVTMGIASIVFQGPAWFETPYFAIANALASLAMTVVTCTVWHQPGMRPLAVGCLGGAFLWSMQWLTTWNVGPFPILGLLAGVWLYVSLGVGFLATTPSDKRSIADSILIWSFFFVATAQFGGLVISRPEWNGYAINAWWPTLWASHGAFKLMINVSVVCWAAIAFAFCIISIRRVRKMKSLDRLVALPVAVGFCCFGLVSGVCAGAQPYVPARQNLLYFSLSLIMLCIPAGLIVSVVSRFVRRIILAEQLNRRLTRRVLTGELIRDEFRNLLKDRSLELFYWSEFDATYVDANGLAASPQLIEKAHFRASISNSDGKPMAIVTGEATLVDHASMLESLLGASAIAIENIQLQANVRAQLEQVRASRVRIVEATLEERRRIERDLHDGVQQRLLAIQTRIGTFRRTENGNTNEMLDELAKELHDALKTLRELARGIHPSELRQFGLRGALEVVVERFPLQVQLEVTEVRFSQAVEATLYFVVSEALNNVLKHANATKISVRIYVDKHNEIILEIADNGNGGAALRRGGGLEGVADRLRTIGGSLDISRGNQSGSILASRLPIVSESI